MAGSGDAAMLVMWVVAPATALVVARHRLRGAGSSAVSACAVAIGAAGFAVVGSALLPTVDAWAEATFARHMVQHLAIGLIGPLLITFGRVPELVPWVLPTPQRSALRRRLRPVLRPPRSIAAPALVVVVTWYGWHLPVLYGAAVEHVAVHVAEHVSFLIAGLWYWAAALSPRHRAGSGILASFAVAVSLGFLASALSLSPVAFYADHVEVASSGAQLDDQHLGGLLMWTPGGLVYLLAAVGQLVRWIGLPPHAQTAPEMGRRA